MLIDVDKYATIVMDKLKMSGYYSEIEPEYLLESIRKYLNAVYNDRIAVLSLKLDLDKQKELPISNDQYKKEYNSIRLELLTMANELAMCKKPETFSLPDLPES